MNNMETYRSPGVLAGRCGEQQISIIENVVQLGQALRRHRAQVTRTSIKIRRHASYDRHHYKDPESEDHIGAPLAPHLCDHNRHTAPLRFDRTSVRLRTALQMWFWMVKIGVFCMAKGKWRQSACVGRKPVGYSNISIGYITAADLVLLFVAVLLTGRQLSFTVGLYYCFYSFHGAAEERQSIESVDSDCSVQIIAWKVGGKFLIFSRQGCWQSNLLPYRTCSQILLFLGFLWLSEFLSSHSSHRVS